jgi:hypothetical protein
MDRSLLEAALIGYQIEAGRLKKAIEDVRARLNGGPHPNSFCETGNEMRAVGCCTKTDSCRTEETLGTLPKGTREVIGRLVRS